ncbi:hypothetical protein PF008_g9609 [Phytophthora fragariae]|uniref:Uncharacterized protein n=1 Tax=Phytophthora fragariae TaxID=53985 RepID=A0A6G0RXN9_9STRA|nr:hypothetical protein PF008_g9609 [Phytophthora fragariae]
MSQVGTVAIALALLTVPNRDTTPCARRPRSGNEMCSGRIVRPSSCAKDVARRCLVDAPCSFRRVVGGMKRLGGR